MKTLLRAIPLLLAGLLGAEAAEPRPIRVLFLGHEGKHHDSGAYCPLLMEALGRDGIFFDYETSPAEALRPERLRHVDAVLLYANHDTIRPAEFAALRDFVENGGGFVPVHSASYCFRNEPGFVRLVGAQFKSHGGGEFSCVIVKPEHPAMTGVKEFHAWDETYVHHLHGDDRTILMERVDDQGREPWTWVRTQGRGRVFYTASGHDQRVWGNPGFHRLLKSGILWAVGDGVRREHEAFLARRPAPKYEKRGDIANYERRPEPLPYQFPLEPAASAAHTQVPADFRLELFADERLIGGNPIALTWDERGRCWVAMTRDYPNTILPDGEGNDEIRILEDTDGDGRADTFTTFADKLNIPTGLLLANGGLYVAMAPHFLFLRDVNGDGRADERKVLFGGMWGKGDTHAGPSSLRYGIDNRLYGAVGYSAFNGEVGGIRHKFGQGVYRFGAQGESIAFLHQFSNNTWGFGQNAAGDTFGSTANGAPNFFCGIPETIGTQRHKVVSARRISESDRVHPVTPNIRQVDVFGGYTSAAGHNFIGGEGLPPRLQDVALVCEPTARLVGVSRLVKDGAGYKARDGFNLVASADEWFGPVHAEVGPDGAVWVADWYDFIIQHNPTPSAKSGGYDARNGKGNAHENPNRDNTRGRIWRVVWKDAPAPALRRLSPSDTPALVAALGSGNPFWRLTAQRLLVEGAARGAETALKAAVRADNGGAKSIHALWALAGLGALDADTLRFALFARDPALRRNAIRAVPNDETGRRLFFESTSLSDADAQNRLAAFVKLAEFEPTPAIRTVVEQLAVRPENQKDEWLKSALDLLRRQHGVGAVSLRKKASGPNLIPNASFEEGGGETPADWSKRHYGGTAEAAWDKSVSRSGKASLRLTGKGAGADTSWFTRVDLRPNTEYELRAWIKADGVSGANGALLNVHELQRTQELMKGVAGSGDWTERVLVFNSADLRSAEINCLLGGWGQARGTAWFDDVSLHERVAEAVPETAPATAAAGDPARGREIFMKHPVAACINCHAVGGQGSAFGPALDGLAARKDMAYITESLLDPNARIAEGSAFEVSPMPPLGLLLKEQEIEDVKAFLGTLK